MTEENMDIKVSQEIKWLRDYSILREIVHDIDPSRLLSNEVMYQSIVDKFWDAETFPEILEKNINPFFKLNGWDDKSILSDLMYVPRMARLIYEAQPVSTPSELLGTIGTQLGHGHKGLIRFGAALKNPSAPSSLLGKAYYVGGRMINSICSRSLLRLYVGGLFDIDPNSVSPEEKEKFEIVQRVTMEALSFKKYATNESIGLIKRLIENPCFDIYCSERELDSETQLKYQNMLSKYDDDLMLLSEQCREENLRGGIDLPFLNLTSILRRDEELITRYINGCRKIIKDLIKIQNGGK